AALLCVVTYQAFGDGWVSMVFPAMGVMFALGGSLMVQSLRRGEALDVIGHRLRRLLPPLWLFGLIAVPVNLWHGWAAQNADGSVTSPLVWSELLYWVFPLVDPPGSDWGADGVTGLWYIRAYLWFVLLTPLMVWFFRRRPLVALAIPLLVVGLHAVLGSPLGEWGAIGPVLVDGGTFAACWMLGFAHREGTLRRVPVLLASSAAVVLVAGGLVWAFTHPAGDEGIDLNDIPFAQALVSFGVVLLVLRVNPAVAWLERVPLLGRFVTVVNARAITIYLWHNVAIAVAVPIGDRLGWNSEGQHFLIAVWLVIVAVFAFGWVEDLAAGRKLSLLPDGRGTQRPARAAPVGPRPPVIPTDVENGVTSALSQGSLLTQALRSALGRVVGATPPPEAPPASVDRVAAVVPTRRRGPAPAPIPVGARRGRATPMPVPPPVSPAPGVAVPVGAGAGPGGYTDAPTAAAPVPVPAPPPPLPAPVPPPRTPPRGGGRPAPRGPGGPTGRAPADPLPARATSAPRPRPREAREAEDAPRRSGRRH
ncbi:MAG: glycosyl transferase, partial [Actinomycetospora sp.]|nr:glycosyl transferase [Actinomycetospora sp.]